MCAALPHSVFSAVKILTKEESEYLIVSIVCVAYFIVFDCMDS